MLKCGQVVFTISYFMVCDFTLCLLTATKWTDSSAFEAFLSKYFSLSDDASEESKTSNSEHNGISFCLLPYVYTAF